MSHGFSCTCPDRPKHDGQRIPRWVVIDLRCNYSAFNGYHRSPSDYSAVGCTGCGARWRTKADYVYVLAALPTEYRGYHLTNPAVRQWLKHHLNT